MGASYRNHIYIDCIQQIDMIWAEHMICGLEKG